jgi:hypothetical protein
LRNSSSVKALAEILSPNYPKVANTSRRDDLVGAGLPDYRGRCLARGPFWFDRLNNVMVIRSTGKSREESGSDGSEDRASKVPTAVIS